MSSRAYVRAAAFVVALLGTACASGGDAVEPSTTSRVRSSTSTSTSAPVARGPGPTWTVAPEPGYTSEVYADPASWLCRPDTPEDPCHEDLDATLVAADGSTTIERFVPAENPSVDCFYVYPTVSTDAEANADMQADEQEAYAVRNQAARLRSVCRLFAPIYRQVTLDGIFDESLRPPGGEDPEEIAYADVLDAWKHYVANDNDGRGVILFGHSQGAEHLERLISEQVTRDPTVRSQLISAYLIGDDVLVPTGAESSEEEGPAEGDLSADVPPCRDVEQLGCFVAYSSFRATSPPPEDSFFGLTFPADEDLLQVACTNPAALAGGRSVLNGYAPTDRAQPFSDPARSAEITTPYVAAPGLVHGECVTRDGASYLEITVEGDPADPRADDIRGDLTPEWGLHLVDVNLALGDLVELARQQAAAYKEHSS